MKKRDLEDNRLKALMESPMIKPQLDFMLIKKLEQKASIHLLNTTATNADVFVVQDVGPGYYQDGVLIKPTVVVGDLVFIVGNLFTLKYKDMEYTMARCREVICVVKSE